MINWTAIAAVIGSIATVVGSYGGYWLAGRNEEQRDQRADAREAAGRRAALADRLEEERHAFQRDTMLELQDQLLELARIWTLVLIEDEKTLKADGKIYLLPDNIGGDKPRLVTASIQRLRTRILDPGLRKAIGDYVTLCSRDSTGLMNIEPDRAIAEVRRREREINEAYTTLAEQLGDHLRMELDRRVLASELGR
jgi:hypothetical protein